MNIVISSLKQQNIRELIFLHKSKSKINGETNTEWNKQLLVMLTTILDITESTGPLTDLNHL